MRPSADKQITNLRCDVRRTSKKAMCFLKKDEIPARQHSSYETSTSTIGLSDRESARIPRHSGICSRDEALLSSLRCSTEVRRVGTHSAPPGEARPGGARLPHRAHDPRADARPGVRGHRHDVPAETRHARPLWELGTVFSGCLPTRSGRNKVALGGGVGMRPASRAGPISQ